MHLALLQQLSRPAHQDFKFEFPRKRSATAGEMGQGWNPVATVYFIRHLLWQRNYLLPHFHVPDIRTINFLLMKQLGIKAIVFDKDNTLTAPYVDTIFPLISDAFSKCVSVFGRDKVVVFSNSAGSSDDKGNAKALTIEKSLGIPVLRHNSKKPFGIKDVRRHFGDEIESKEIAMIGDRYATDILFGNLNGMLTIHSSPLTPVGELPIVRLMRRIEDGYISSLAHLRPPFHPLHRPDITSTTNSNGNNVEDM